MVRELFFWHHFRYILTVYFPFLSLHFCIVDNYLCHREYQSKIALFDVVANKPTKHPLGSEANKQTKNMKFGIALLALAVVAGVSNAFQSPMHTSGRTSTTLSRSQNVRRSNGALMAATMDGTAVNGQLANGARRKKTKQVSFHVNSSSGDR